jgi:hypothetical protein
MPSITTKSITKTFVFITQSNLRSYRISFTKIGKVIFLMKPEKIQYQIPKAFRLCEKADGGKEFSLFFLIFRGEKNFCIHELE